MCLKFDINIICGSQLESPESLPAQKEVAERSTHKVPQSPFLAPSPCMGLAKELGALELERKDFLAALDQNLVKITVAHPHFAEKKNIHFVQRLNTRDQ